MGEYAKNKIELIFPELSYEIVGCAFDVFNSIGSGHPEKYYQKALAKALSDKGVVFAEQQYSPLKFKDKVVGKNFIDFVIEDKIVVEIKKGERYSKANIDQVVNYLRTANLKLAILINFGKEGVMFKRIVNINQPIMNQYENTNSEWEKPKII